MGRVALRHHRDLLLDVLDLVLRLFEVDHFYCHRLSRLAMAPTEDFAKGALADALEALVRIRVHRHGVALWPMSRMWSAWVVWQSSGYGAPVPAAHAATSRGGALDA